MQIVLSIDPASLSTQQQKGVRVVKGRPQFYVKKKVEVSADRLRCELVRVLGIDGDNRRDAYLRRTGSEVRRGVCFLVGVQFFYRPKSLPRRLMGCYKSTRPDVDNLIKLVLDVVTDLRVWWADDAQVQVCHALKLFCREDEEPRIVLSVLEVNDNGGV